ncbi:hypothetical protein [Helicobacter mustelae]|uniref:Putative outer membrane protein n=1 Tax=Helicobacter mustelae (strain ATCC 43772 / CCUG 25715 / CIP 103759 / LMG 18044 / NCTC 12198 / R85-136P) TaxID=679897 RepID=D3UFR2_HELM1|nr:hypothetical protein [Helicobacter mustelae]CBG39333.1 putative outer membrane protein [Helicobacter mustelae 12198]SQH70845.1 Uncharacterised protein [Helicobacter mustelae]
MNKITKKLILPLVFASSAEAIPSGIFVGGDIGVNIGLDTGIAKARIEGIPGYKATSFFSPTFGARVGYILAINNYNAFKFTLSYNSAFYDSKASMKIGAGIDYLLSFSDKPDAAGLFLGGGYDFGIHDFAKGSKSYPNSKSNAPFAQIGIFKSLGSEGRWMLQFGAKYNFGSPYHYKSVTSPAAGTIVTREYKGSGLLNLFFNVNYTF